MHTTCTVKVQDGDQSLEERICRLLRLRDGRRAAVWRGLAYPLGDGDTIDIAGEGVPPGECLPHTGAVPTASQRFRWAVVEGAEEVWILVAGSVADRNAAAVGLRQAGLAVLRSGSWLGEPADGLDADWFVRIGRPAGNIALGPLLEHILGERLAPRADDAAAAEDLRLRLVRAELGRARNEAAALRAEAERLRKDVAGSADLAARLTTLQADLDRALAELEKGRLAPEAPPSVAAAPPPPLASPAPAPPRLVRRLQDEVATMLESLLPDVRLMRDSLTVASAEFRDRKAFYRALGELMQGAGRLPPAWKKLRGVDGWWERHVSNGEDDAGRAYARFGVGGSGWDVLLSHKAEQHRDIDWLRSLR